MQFKPRLDFVTVQLEEVKKTSERGILLPESAQEDRREGKVISVGPGRINDDGITVRIDGLEVGSKVLVNPFAGRELDKNERLFLFRESDIPCTLQ